MKKMLYVLVIIIHLLIISRVIFLSVFRYDHYYEIMRSNQNFIHEGMSAPRGRILDVNGNILVDNIGVKSIIYNKLSINTARELEIAIILAENIELEPNVSEHYLRYYFYRVNQELIDQRVDSETRRDYLERRITSDELLDIKLDLITDEELEETNELAAYFYYLMNKGYAYQDKIIKTNITDEEYILINSLNLEGIRTDITWERVYPFGDVLREVLGRVSTQNQGLTYELRDEFLAKGYNLNDRVGITNLEFIYDHYLRGEKAQFKVQNNRLTKIQDYRRGKDIILSIDIELQMEVEEILKGEILNARRSSGSRYFRESYVVISNPNNGMVKALVGQKIDEDNNFIDNSIYNALNSFTVGSVVKGATHTVGFKHGLIDENTRIYDGCVRLYAQLPKCSWRALGLLNDQEALRMSSNYWQYQIAIKLTGNTYQPGMILNADESHFEEFRDVFGSFGLGTLTEIDLSNEVSGMKGDIISDDLLLNFSIGQYDTYTPLQLNQYISTIATGQRRPLRILKQVLNHDGSIYFEHEAEILNEIPLDDKYLDRIRSGFRLVTQRGTAYGYTDHNITSAGKTGTAESYYAPGVFTYTTAFAMYAPFENPEISISIISPNIGYRRGDVSSYRYPINARVARRVTSVIFNNQD